MKNIIVCPSGVVLKAQLILPYEDKYWISVCHDNDKRFDDIILLFENIGEEFGKSIGKKITRYPFKKQDDGTYRFTASTKRRPVLVDNKGLPNLRTPNSNEVVTLAVTPVTYDFQSPTGRMTGVSARLVSVKC